MRRVFCRIHRLMMRVGEATLLAMTIAGGALAGERLTAKSLEFAAPLDRLDRHAVELRRLVETRSAPTMPPPAERSAHAPPIRPHRVDRPTFAAGEGIVMLSAAQSPPATDMLKVARELRARIAREWFEEGDDTGERIAVLIHLRVTDDENSGLTLPPRDAADPTFRIWVAAPDLPTLERILSHEMTHVVLSVRFKGRLPLWADEGLASQEDDPARLRLRREIVRHWKEANAVPSLEDLVLRRSIVASDRETYAAAALFAQFLTERLGRRAFVRWLDDIAENGWNDALSRQKSFANSDTLQEDWRRWLLSPEGKSPAPSSRVTENAKTRSGAAIRK